VPSSRARTNGRFKHTSIAVLVYGRRQFHLATLITRPLRNSIFTPEKQVRVFISSTFRDMHAEQDHLVTVVFPELRERVEQLGPEFFDVDLRWGVTGKEAL